MTGNQPHATTNDVLPAVEAFVSTLDLDEVGAVRAKVALALGAKLDQAAEAKASVGLGAAVPGIARELRDTLTELEMSQGEAEAFLGQLFELPKVRLAAP